MTTPPPGMRTGDVTDYSVDEDISLDQVVTIINGDAPMLVAPGVDIAPSLCGACGVMIGHQPTHARFHTALGALAQYVDAVVPVVDDDTAPSNEPRIGADGRPV